MQLFGGKNKGKHTASTNRDSHGEHDIRSDENTDYGRDATGDPEEYTDKQVKKGGARWIRGVVLAVLIIVALGTAVWAGFKLWVKAPDISADKPVTVTSSPTPEADPDSSATPEPTEEPGESEAPDVIDSSNRREGVYTFALMGLDIVGNNMDTIVVGMFDTVAGKLNLVTIPRDTLINTGYDVKKPNYIYPACINQGRDGVQPTLDALADLLGYDLDCYAIVDTSAVEQLVDTIGGVWFDVPLDMFYNGWDQKPPIYIDLQKGYQLLDGADFVRVARFRYTTDKVTGKISGGYPGGDVDRIQTQHDLLMALMKQMLDLGNIPNLSKFIEIYEENVTTNLTARNIGYFASEFLKLDYSDITFNTLPGDASIWLYDISYISPYINQWLDMVNEYLNPFTVEITQSNVDMLSFDGENFYATIGYIRGGEYSFLGAQA